MTGAASEFLSVDLGPLLAAVLAAVSCGLLGNFLLLRRLSLMGDAISHSVLPGLVIAFILTGERTSAPMFVGALVSALATVLLVELVSKVARVEGGAAMGVVFSIFFALGVLLLERAAARQADLDADCVLHGQLEAILWLPPPSSFASLLDWDTLTQAPRQVQALALVTVLVVAAVVIFFKELRICAFDPELATSLGFSSRFFHAGLMILVAVVTVASFEAVGSILVIAMLICPAATARMLTDRLSTQLLLSGAVALSTAVLGYLAAGYLPLWLGSRHAWNAAGCMTVAGGAVLAMAMVFSPTYGVLGRWRRQRRQSLTVAVEDVLALLYRWQEDGKAECRLGEVEEALPGQDRVGAALRQVAGAGDVRIEGASVRLTEQGRRRAAAIVRSHRLWEAYLVEKVGLSPDHVHDSAMLLEHAREPESGVRLAPAIDRERDPHDRPIPPDPDPER